MGHDDVKVGISPTASFKIALKNQKESLYLGEDQVTELQDVSLKDVVETIVRVERSREEKERLGSGSRIQNQLKSLLTFVERYSKAIDCLVQTSSGLFINPAVLIWGLLRIVLEVFEYAFFLSLCCLFFFHLFLFLHRLFPFSMRIALRIPIRGY